MSLHAQIDDTLKVLFVGNSHTYFNNMPWLFDSLSESSPCTQGLDESAGRAVIVDMSAPGGYTLEQHSTNATTINMISQGDWDYVVLQEQSQIPVINY